MDTIPVTGETPPQPIDGRHVIDIPVGAGIDEEAFEGLVHAAPALNAVAKARKT